MSVEVKLVSFVNFAISKLDAAAESLEDEDPADNFAELCTFATGMARNLRAVGSAGSGELKGALSAGLASVWCLSTDKPGLELAGVDSLRAALESLIATDGPLGEAAQAEPEDEDPDGADPSDISLQDAITHMWSELDKPNRLEWGEGFTLDLQQKGAYRSNEDRSDAPLFTWVNDESPFWSSRVTKAFIALLDNFERGTGTTEVTTREEKGEMSEFIDALISTPVVRFAFKWLRAHGSDRRCAKLRTISDFGNLLYDVWMAPYRRYRANDSSGFEHVFVGEEKKGQIIGLHNWVQYYLEEKKGNINYLGWSGKQDLDYSDDCNIVTVKFAWDDSDAELEVKPMSTILCGSTIEFEIAALSMCFLGGNQDGDNALTLGSESLNIKCYPQRVRYGGPAVATAFFEIAR